MQDRIKQECRDSAGRAGGRMAVALWVCFFFCSVLPLPLPNGYTWVLAFIICLIIFASKICRTLKHAESINVANWWFVSVQIIGVSFFLTFLLYSKVTFLFYTISFCFFIPLMYMVFRECGAEFIIFTMAKGFYIAFWVFVVVSFAIGPAYNAAVQYTAILSNPNEFGFLLTSVMPCIGFFFVRCLKRGERGACLHVASMATVVTLSLMTGSRTTELSLLPQIIIIFIIALRVIRLRSCEGKRVRPLWNNVISWMLTFAIAGCGTLGMFTVGKTVLNVLGHTPSEAVLVRASSSSVDGGDLAAMLESNIARYSKGSEAGSINDFSSGRLGIWSSFLQDIEILGHESETKPVVSGQRIYDRIYAHNVFLQVSYSAGFFAGIAMCVVMIVSLARSLSFLRDKEGGAACGGSICLTVFVSCAIFGFFVYSLLGDGYAMFKYLPASVFWISSAALCSSLEVNGCRLNRCD